MENNKPTGDKKEERLYRWVKASERLPEKDYSFGEDEFGCFPVRWQFEYRTVLSIGFLNKDKNEIWNSFNSEPFVSEIEWLEEYASQKQELKAVSDEEIKKMALKFYNEQELPIFRLSYKTWSIKKVFLEGFKSCQQLQPKELSEVSWEEAIEPYKSESPFKLLQLLKNHFTLTKRQ